MHATITITPPAHCTGDNLKIMPYLADESIDLIYADPPFNSKRIYKATANTPATGASFKDTWTLADCNKQTINRLMQLIPQLPSLSNLCLAHSKNLQAYILYMSERLYEMHRLLKPTGSLYLHCDPTASHYLKILLDVIFGEHNFRNEIIWSYRTGGNSKKWFARKHDVIFFYAKSSDHLFYPQKQKSYCTSTPPGFQSAKIYKDDNNHAYTMATVRDVWDINALGRSAKERLGYPTQKPLELLRRIIASASKESDIVLDPFCGCGTTSVAAEMMGRRWIGMDICDVSVKLLRQRLPSRDFQHFVWKNHNLHAR